MEALVQGVKEFDMTERLTHLTVLRDRIRWTVAQIAMTQEQAF